MARCPTCEYPLPNDRDRLGARCPRCREPLYEPAGRFPRPAPPGEPTCAVHTASEAVGVCNRCARSVCEACRSLWRSQVLCVACLEQAMQSGEAVPEATRVHVRQGVLSLSFGAGAWLLFAVAELLLAYGGDGQVGVLLLVLLLFLGAGLLALFGVGLGAAALRGRGARMPLAGVGLGLSGLFVGVLVGLIALSVWQF